MDASSYTSAVETGGAEIALLAAGRLEIPLPSCPDWTLEDLLRHLGGVYRWAGSALRGGGEKPGDDWDGGPEDTARLVDWFTEAHGQLVGELRARHPEDPAWAFVSSAPQTAAFWYRRQAHETAIHQFDARLAAGSPSPLDAELAADGVDEYFTTFFERYLARNPVEGLSGTLHLHATDTPGEWSLDLDAEDKSPRLEHSKADTALRGPASGLNLWIWNRQSPAEAGLEVFGDGSVVEAFSRVQI